MNSGNLLLRQILPGVVLAPVLFAAASKSLAAEAEQNWGQWRGPLGTGVSPTANPPVSWNENENVKWKVKLPGRGTGTPVIWDNTIFIQTAIPTGKKIDAAAVAGPVPAAQQREQPRGPAGRPRGGGGFGRQEKPTEVHRFALLAIDRANGKIRWQKIAREEVPHEGHHQDHSFASSSPVTDGTHVWAYFGSRGLHCYDMQGNLKWSKDFGRMQTKMGFGEGSSPALHGNTVVVNWDHEGDDFVYALDKTTGKELWRQPRNENTSWATPLIVEHRGKAQVVTSATGKIRSYDLVTGKLVWECSGMTDNAIPTPVPGKDMVYVTSGFRGSALLAIKLGRTGDLTGTDAIAWQHNKSTPYVPSPLLYNERLYFFSKNDAMLSCLDAKTGKPLIDARRLDALQGVYASPVAAQGRIYLVGRNGAAFVIKDSNKVLAESDPIDVLATNKLDEGIEASPALVGNELFLRGRESLYCIAAKN